MFFSSSDIDLQYVQLIINTCQNVPTLILETGVLTSQLQNCKAVEMRTFAPPPRKMFLVASKKGF